MLVDANTSWKDGFVSLTSGLCCLTQLACSSGGEGVKVEWQVIVDIELTLNFLDVASY